MNAYLKVLSPSSDQVHGVARLRREAQALARLSHPNVVTIHEVGVYDGRPCVAMEFVEGGSLRDWLQRTPPSEREPGRVAEVLSQAASGLIAAHEAGIVHRDFKPSNVLLGADGRVRVADFGLALTTRLDGDLETLELFGVSTKSELVPTATRDPSEPSVLTDRVVGTPAYMAPEQFLVPQVDARADQFAWCSVAWEAIYGCRPFAAIDSAQRLEHIGRSRLQREFDPTGWPNGIEGLLRRGLARDPGRRFSTLSDLVSEFDRLVQADGEHRPGRLSRRTMALGVASVLGLTWWWGTQRTTPPCNHGRAQIQSVWSPEVQDAIKANLTSRSRDDGLFAWQKVSTQLEAYTEAWAAMHDGVCSATRVRGDQSEHVLDLKMWCLDDARIILDALGRELMVLEGDVVGKIPGMLTGLKPLDACGDLRSLEDAMLPPADRSLRASVAGLRARIATANMARMSGHVGRAVALLDEIEQDARVLGYEPLLAHLLVVRGFADRMAGDYERSERTLREGLRLSIKWGSWLDSLSASQHLMYLIGGQPGRSAEALAYGELALGLAEKPSLPKASLARTYYSLALTHKTRGDLERAREAYFRAVDLWDELDAGQNWQRANSLTSLGIVYRLQGEFEAATQAQKRALQIFRDTFGDRHPKVAIALLNLSNLLLTQGKYVDASREAQESYEIFTASLGTNHLYTGFAAGNMAIAERELGHFEVLAFFEELMSRSRTDSPTDRKALAALKRDLALALARAGRWDEASSSAAEALAGAQQAMGEDATELIEYLLVAGEVELIAGNLAKAATYLGRARELARGEGEPFEHERIAVREAWLASSRRETAGEVIESISAALRVLESRLHETHGEVLIARAVLALTLETAGEVTQAASAAREFLDRVVEAEFFEPVLELRVRRMLAEVLRDRNDREEARSVLEAGVERVAPRVDERHPDVAQTQQLLASLR